MRDRAPGGSVTSSRALTARRSPARSRCMRRRFRRVTESSWISGEQHTITSLLDRRLSDDPDSQYLDVCGVTFTAAEVNTTASKLANALHALGVRPGDRVANLVENSPEGLLSWFGAIRGGSIAVPINTAYKGQYLRHQLGDSGSAVVVVQRTLADRIAAVIGDLPELEHVIVVDDREEPGAGQEISPTAKVAVHEWDELLQVDATTPTVTIRPSDLGTFIYTGGTTGPSKGCMLSHNYHEALARQIGICWERTADDVVWTPLPLFHYNALVTAVLGSLVFGGRGAIYRRFSVSNFWPEMNRVGATITSTLGTMAYLLAQRHRPAGDAEVGRARGEHDRCGLLGAAPLPEEVDNQHPRALRCRDVQRRVRSDRGEPRLVAATGRAQQAERGRRPERRVLRRTPVRRRREGSAAGREGRDRRPPEATARDVRGLLGPTRRDRRGDAQPLVPHRRHRPARRGRLPLLRRPQGRTTSAGAARTSRASRSRASSWATACSSMSRCARSRAR